MTLEGGGGTYESQDYCAVCGHTITCHIDSGCLGGGTAKCGCAGFRSPADESDVPARLPRALGDPSMPRALVQPGVSHGPTPVSFTPPVVSPEDLSEILEAIADFCQGQMILHGEESEASAWFDAAQVRLRRVARRTP